MLTSTVEDLPDDVEVVSAWLHERGHTDGLPVVPPTRERVLRMLDGTTRDPAATLGDVPPVNGAATVEKLAINAVMAGCRAEYLPVLLTSFDLMLRPSFQLAGMQPTTNPLTPMLIVNGPIRHRIGLRGRARSTSARRASSASTRSARAKTRRRAPGRRCPPSAGSTRARTS
jgi:hypothetical protein